MSGHAIWQFGWWRNYAKLSVLIICTVAQRDNCLNNHVFRRILHLDFDIDI